MRCAVVCPIATGGGVTESFLTSLDMLADQGQTPIAIVPRAFRFADRLAARGYERHAIDDLERGGALNLARHAYAIARRARAAQADIIILNNGRFVRGVKFFAPRTPLVAIYHGGKLTRFLSADRIITINDEQLRYLHEAGYPKERCAIVDNALPLMSLPAYAARSFEADKAVVGTLRLLEPAKGVDVLVAAIGVLAARGKRFRCRIGSSGSQEAALKAQARALGIADLVEFCGWIDDKPRFFDSLDIYVLPSRAEEWGIGIVEANAARLPVIATACLGPRRIIRDGETGLIVPIGDPHAMADAIETLAGDPVRAESLARKAYAHCEQNYLFPKIAPIFTREALRVLEAHA